MAESGLSVGYANLRKAVGYYLGYGQSVSDWSSNTDKTAHVEDAIQSGVRQVYYPPAIDKSILGYEWSWLRPTTTLTTADGTGDYDLPDDFGTLFGLFHFPADEYRTSIAIVSIGKLLAMRAVDQSGPPRYAAIRYKAEDRTTGSRQEVLFYPEPNEIWALPYEYEAYSGALSTGYPYPLGGMQLAELYIESCLSIAEQRYNDETGLHTQRYQALLLDAVARDRKRGASVYGQMGGGERGLTEFRRGYTGGTYPITYKGEDV